MTYSKAHDDEFTIEHFPNGRFRLCLDTSDPTKIPRFRQAVDCVEKILQLPRRHFLDDSRAIDGDWSE